MFKIVDVKKGETKISKMESPYFLIEVYFTTDDGDASFGYLGKYYSAIMVEDAKKYEDFYNDPKNLEWEFEGDEDAEKLAALAKELPESFCRIACARRDRLGVTPRPYGCCLAEAWYDERSYSVDRLHSLWCGHTAPQRQTQPWKLA